MIHKAAPDEPVLGFILQPTYRIEQGRPVVHLFGKLESGESFLVRDDRSRPHFYVREKDAGELHRLGAPPASPSERVTLEGEPVLRIDVPTPGDTPEIRDRLQAAGVRCYEADVRFAMRYLIDRGIQGTAAIRGSSRPEGSIDRVFVNPDLESARSHPPLIVLSIDIETDLRAERLLAIALATDTVREVLLLTEPGDACPGDATPCASESELLARFGDRVKEIDPDVITGWNINEFDLPVLQRISKRTRQPLELGRLRGAVRWSSGPRGFARPVTIPGRVVLDGIPLLRGAFVKMESYTLEAVAQDVLGEGKTVAGADRGQEIQRLFLEDRARFVEYNLKDARLVLDILRQLELIELTIERSHLTGMPPDRVSSSIAAFDFLYLSRLHRRKIVAPTVGAEPEEAEGTAGGHVLTPCPGLFDNILVFDFKSLYPSIIRTFQIDPLGLLPRGESTAGAIVSPSGAAFRREKGILTQLLDDLFPRREAAKKARNAVASHAIKILMNSFYGVLGTPACRFHNGRIANSITSFGRELLLWTKERAEARGHRVLYGDTDSIFVDSSQKDPDRAWEVGRELVQRLNEELTAHIMEKWRVESQLELQLERLYLRLFLPPVRHGTEGARKRYVGFIREGNRERVKFTGMEAVRRDWTDLARDVQRQLYERLFRDQEIKDYLRSVVKEVQEGRRDDALVYRKALRKNREAYTSTTPPHVAAARKMGGKPPRVIAYVITTDGPEPADERKHPFDYEHYLMKQIRPVAEPVLALLNLDFASIIGRDQQLELF